MTAILAEIRQSPELLSGPPPPALLTAIAHGLPAHDEEVLNLARAWPRIEMSRALIRALRGEKDGELRARLGWLVKHVLAAEDAADAVTICLDPAESPAVQGWVLGGLEQLAFAGLLSWNDLGSLVEHARGSGDPNVRVRVASLLLALPWRGENVPLLDALLDDADPEVIVAAAHTLALRAGAVPHFDQERLARLRGHPNAWVRQTAAELDAALQKARSKRRAREPGEP